MTEKAPGRYLADAHIHTSGISLCSRVSPKRLIEICRIEGLGGILLCNHYKSAHVRGDFSDWRKRYAEEFYITKRYGDEAGINVIFGVEVTLDEDRARDYVLYGLSPEDILEADPLFRLSLRELSSYTHEKGGLLCHAHPFRGTTPAPAEFLDFTEINCHPLYRTCAEEGVRAFADTGGLGITCGSDYHGDTYKPHCGVYLPQSVTDSASFAAFLKAEPRPPLLIAPDPAPGAGVAPGQGGVEGIL